MNLVSLSITDFRNIEQVTFEPERGGTTVITGLNGAGKTSVLEAVSYLSTMQSFRGSPREALVRRGAERSVLRAETVVDGRVLTIEAEFSAESARMFVNRQRVRRRGDLHQALRTTTFTPDAIQVVRGAPGDRRRFLDDTLAVVDPKEARHSEEVERILRQRSALLRSTSRRQVTPEVTGTLNVWDARLDAAGSALADARAALAVQLVPLAESHYARLAGRPTRVILDYQRSWSGPLLAALSESRAKDIERGTSSVGPHRDELVLSLDGLPGRSHASQGEQRTLALALELAAHQLATERLGTPPVLLLDDVFSELDPHRSRALLAGLPAGQALITTAFPAPPELPADKIYAMAAGGHIVAPPAGLFERPNER